MAECGNKEWVMKKGTHYKIEGFVALHIFFLLMICLFVYTIFFLSLFIFILCTSSQKLFYNLAFY